MSRYDFCYSAQAEQVPFSTVKGGMSKTIPLMEPYFPKDEFRKRPLGQVNWILKDKLNERVFSARKIMVRLDREVGVFLESEEPIEAGGRFETLEVSAQSSFAKYLRAPDEIAQHQSPTVGVIEGTRIMTVNGECRVEDLAVGDLVVTRDNGMQPVRWIGETLTSVNPIFIPRQTIHNSNDLLVCPETRIALKGGEAMVLFAKNEVLVQAKHYTNNADVQALRPTRAKYYQIMLDQHDLIYVEAIACESFYPDAINVGVLPSPQKAELEQIIPDVLEDVTLFGPQARWHLDMES